MTTTMQAIDRVAESKRLYSAVCRRAARKRRRFTAPFLLLVSLLPFVFLWWVFVNNYHYLLLPLPWISEWLYVHADIVAAACFLFICNWLLRRPARKLFQGSVLWWTVYCLIPVGLFMLLVFSQRHIIVSVVIVCGTLIAYYTMCAFVEASDQEDCRAKAKLTARAHRTLAAVFLAIMLVPACLSVFRYRMISKEVEYQHIFTEALGDVMLEHIEAVNDRSEIYKQHLELFDAIRSWERLSPQRRQDAIVELVEMECEVNRIPNTLAKVKFLSTEEGLLGYYDEREKALCLSQRVMNNYSAETALTTTLHEFYHYYQQYICSLFDGDDGIGWDSPLATEQYRLWRANQGCYLSTADTGMDGYANQPLEVSAREYAEQEYDRLIEMIVHGFED